MHSLHTGWFVMLILSAVLAFVYIVFTCIMMYGCREVGDVIIGRGPG